LRQLPEADHQLAWQLVRLSQVGCGELGEIAAEIGRDLLSKPAGNREQDVDVVEVNFGQDSNLPTQISSQPASTIPVDNVDIDEAEVWLNQGYQQAMAGDLLGAVASYDQALQIQPDNHEAWNNRGNALGSLGRIEQAIASWDKALHIKPDYHEAWYNRGVVLDNLGRIEEAIASWDKALHIKPDYHEAWYNRGVVLDNLGRIEEAIASYDQAVQIKPDLHEAWNNRGSALVNLGRFEEAITSWDKALHIKPDFHEAWYNRGVVLDNLERFEEAITSWDKALHIKPDYHEAWYNRGTALANLGLGRIEEAITSWDKALHIKPDFHQAWINRGIAAGQSLNYNSQAAIFLQQQFPSSPEVIPNPTLTRRGYEGQLLTYREGLKHCPQDTHPEGWGLLHQAIGNAHYFQGKGKSNYREYWRKALAEYHQALITLTPEAFPEVHLEVVQKLIRVLFRLGKDTEAKQWRRHGLEVFRKLLNSKTTSFQRRQLEVKFISFSQMRVHVLVEDGDLVPALEAAERNKNLYLTWILDAQNEHILSPSYQEIQQQLLNPTTAIIYWHLSEFALTTFIIKHDATEPLIISSPPFSREVGGDLQHHDTPNESLKRLRNFETWVNNWNKQYQDYRSGKEKASPPQPPLVRGEQENASLAQSWRDNLPEMLRHLGDLLNISAILSTLTDINQLILIPHRDLHRFPLHALFPTNFTITYLPSAQIGITLSNSSLTKGDWGVFNSEKIVRAIHLSNSPLTKGGWGGNLLSVEHPNSEGYDQLPYAEIESAAITQLFHNPKRLAGADATKTALEAALPTEYTIFHFTGHGTYDFNRPSQSSLILSGNDKLTLEDICRLPLNHYRLVSLSACETALTSTQTIETEYVGLVSAFLYQRVTHVVSTLWTLESAASALFMIKFYRLIKKGVPETAALRKTQQWLRQLSAGKLARLYRKAITQLPEDENKISPFLETELRKVNKMEPTRKLYEHPYYWAAFTITGYWKPDA
jgi:CHAT domain-containing protein/Flp pilus assembly protein TadD